MAELHSISSSDELIGQFQQENDFWVLSHFIQNKELNSNIRNAAQIRLNTVSTSPLESAGAIVTELITLVGCMSSNRPGNAYNRVNDLLSDIENHAGYELWKGPINSARAKHYLAQNDFSQALKYFKIALDSCSERNYGSLRGLVARDTMATIIQIEKFNLNNHEKYYREILAYGGCDHSVFDGVFLPGLIFSSELIQLTTSSLEKVKSELNKYFWQTLHQPYTGF